MTLIRTVVLFTLLWWAFAGHDPASWLVGAPAIALAAIAAHVLAGESPRRRSISALLLFSVYFFVHSVRAGIDVAARAFSLQPRLDPGFLDYPLTLPDQTSRVLFMNCISLLPGTLTCGIRGDTLTVHALCLDATTTGELADLEGRIARIFYLPGPKAPK